MISKIFLIFLFGILCFISGSTLAGMMILKKTVYYRELSEKHLAIMEMFKKWLIMIEHGKKIDSYFKENNYKTVAIYGMGFLGERLLDELNAANIDVKYLIDKKSGSTFGEMPVLPLAAVSEPVDVIIVTPVYYFYSIKKELEEKTIGKVISIETILE